MRIGVPKEIKTLEFRVGLTPDSVFELVNAGHEVFVETNAGAGIDFTDGEYKAAGAKILATPEEVFETAELIVKVKEPQLHECAMLRKDQTLFTYLHLAADKPQAEALVKSGCYAIAYETVTADIGGLPLLRPMSEVAGRMSVQVGAACLQMAAGGRGVLLGGVPGTEAANVVIIGGGVSGYNAAQMAVGMRANVTIFDRSLNRLEELDTIFGNKVQTVYSTAGALAEAIKSADLVIGAVLIPGAAAPKLISREQLSTMRRGAVLVDISIDQGGCFETSKPTTHEDPYYNVDGIVHYCVANMPGAVARTSTLALNNRTLPHVVNLANLGTKPALRVDKHLKHGLNVAEGWITHEAVAEDLAMKFKDADDLI
ncbi:MAG: alanine dehydrogenase [bacterium]